MAHTKSSIKDLKRTKKRTERNKALRSKMRTYLKKARHAVDEGTADSTTRVESAIQVLDKMASKGIITDNNASRRKKRLMKRLNVSLNIGKPEVLKTEKKLREESYQEISQPETSISTEEADAAIIAESISDAETGESETDEIREEAIVENTEESPSVEDVEESLLLEDEEESPSDEPESEEKE